MHYASKKDTVVAFEILRILYVTPMPSSWLCKYFNRSRYTILHHSGRDVDYPQL